MLRGLKITMVVFGVTLGIEGILDIAFPDQRAKGMGLDQCASHARLSMAVLGATWVVAGAWIATGARDPLRHLDCVKFALAVPLVLLLALLGSAIRGDVPFQKIAVDIGFNVLFFVLFLVFFPRGGRAGASESRG